MKLYLFYWGSLANNKQILDKLKKIVQNVKETQCFTSIFANEKQHILNYESDILHMNRTGTHY